MREESIWKGSPSQLENAFSFFFLFVISVLIIPIFIIFWKWLTTKMTVTELTTQRLIKRTGVLNRQVDEIELYRVKDYRVEKPLSLSIFGLSNVTIVTSDQLTPVVTIRAVSDGEGLRNTIRTIVEKRRAEKGVREIDT